MKYCDGRMVTIKQGDTLYAISVKYQVPLALLLRANPYVDVYNLQPGDTICVPMNRRESQDTPMVPDTMTSISMTTNGTISDSRDEGAVVPDNSTSEPLIDNETVVEWKRYVTQPGDTLDLLIGEDENGNQGEALEAFVQRNGADRIMLLPGVAYYQRK